jgi:hypothetical protein
MTAVVKIMSLVPRVLCAVLPVLLVVFGCVVFAMVIFCVVATSMASARGPYPAMLCVVGCASRTCVVPRTVIPQMVGAVVLIFVALVPMSFVPLCMMSIGVVVYRVVSGGIAVFRVVSFRIVMSRMVALLVVVVGVVACMSTVRTVVSGPVLTAVPCRPMMIIGVMTVAVNVT